MCTKEDIEEWKDNGREKGYNYLIVACDTFEYEDFPVYAFTEEQANFKSRELNNSQKMTRVHEVIHL